MYGTRTLSAHCCAAVAFLLIILQCTIDSSNASNHLRRMNCGWCFFLCMYALTNPRAHKFAQISAISAAPANQSPSDTFPRDRDASNGDSSCCTISFGRVSVRRPQIWLLTRKAIRELHVVTVHFVRPNQHSAQHAMASGCGAKRTALGGRVRFPAARCGRRAGGAALRPMRTEHFRVHSEGVMVRAKLCVWFV